MPSIELLQLADWRRRIAQLYAAMRSMAPRAAWDLWREEREALFLTHAQSPLPTALRDAAHAPCYFDYDESLRRHARVLPAKSDRITLPGSGTAAVEAVRFATALVEGLRPLSLFWLRDYAGGIFVSFRDATSGVSTYGGGRYLLDTAKGADLGGDADALVMDFNFAYQPSCSYDARWECPLPPRENWLDVAVHAGERLSI